jgi:hypothetical protein
MNRISKMNVLAAVLLILVASVAFAQPQPNQGGFQGGAGQGAAGQGARGGFDPTQIRSLLSQRVQEALELTEKPKEWEVLAPKIERVQQIQTDLGGGIMGSISMFARLGGGRGLAGRGGQGGANPGGGRGGGFDLSAILGPETPLRRKVATLQTLLDNPATPEADIRQLLTSIREDRARAQAELAVARKELVELLTSRQEGVLFQMGLLE